MKAPLKQGNQVNLRQPRSHEDLKKPEIAQGGAITVVDHKRGI